jgi:hypothetical protein
MPRTLPSRRAGSAREEKAPDAATRGAAAGLERMKREQEKADARAEASKLTANEPFRFFIKEGMETQFIVVDDEPSFFRNEHQLQDPKTKRFSLHVPCIDEVANCPACEVDTKQPSFCMYLTVIDLTEYTNSKDEVITWSKKMLVVKLGQQKKFVRVWEKEGTLRGALFTVSRTGKMSSNIGSDIDFEEFVTEEELRTYETEYEDKDGNIVEVFGDEPFNYDEIYPALTEAQIAQVVGFKDESTARSHRGGARRASTDESEAPARRGSRRSERAQADEPAEPAPRTAGRRSARQEPAEEPAARRPASRRSAAPAEDEPETPAPRRAATRRQAEVPEDPPQRSAAAPRRRAAAAPAEDNPLPDEAPAATDRASRRAALRGTR